MAFSTKEYCMCVDRAEKHPVLQINISSASPCFIIHAVSMEPSPILTYARDLVLKFCFSSSLPAWIFYFYFLTDIGISVTTLQHFHSDQNVTEEMSTVLCYMGKNCVHLSLISQLSCVCVHSLRCRLFCGSILIWKPTGTHSPCFDLNHDLKFNQLVFPAYKSE